MKLTAPIGRTGTIHASASGTNYTIDAQGFVEVDARDVRDLLSAGFNTEPVALPAPVAIKSTLSAGVPAGQHIAEGTTSTAIGMTPQNVPLEPSSEPATLQGGGQSIPPTPIV
jgi:hypothetical protein